MRTKHELILASKNDEVARLLLEMDNRPDYIPQKTREHLIAIVHNTCNICRRKCHSSMLHIDHILPLSRGGKAYIENLQVLCRTCNLQKGSSHIEPRSYEVGYVIPIDVLTNKKIYGILLEKIDDPNT